MHNFRVMRIAAAVFVVVLDTCANAQPRPDSCQALIPRSLARPLTAAFPGYRTPLETDNAPDDIEYSKAHGGTGCLGVATGIVYCYESGQWFHVWVSTPSHP